MERSLRGLENFLSRTSGSLLWASSVALMWFMFHTVPLEKHSVINLSLILLLAILGVGLPAAQTMSKSGVQMLLIVVALTLLAATTGFLHTGSLSNARASVLILVFVLVGVTVGCLKNEEAVLVGLGSGSFFVHVQGVMFQYLDPSRNLISGNYLGVTGRESTEILSAFVGLAVGLALIRKQGLGRFLASFFIVANLIMIWRIDLTIGLIAAFFMVTLAIVIWIFGTQNTRLSGSQLTLGVLIAGALLAALVAERNLALSLAEFLGEYESVKARFAIWDSALSSVSIWGLIFGYGASFWREGSGTLNETREALDSLGLRPLGHAHSMYLDFFLSFGLAGTTLAVALIGILYRASTSEKGEYKSLTAATFAWTLIPSLAIFGMSESVLLFYPPGWFLGSLLLGLLLRRFGRNSSPEPVASFR